MGSSDCEKKNDSARPTQPISAVGNYSDIFRNNQFAVIPAKAGIQVLWIPTIATVGLDARLRGHDGWNVQLVSIKIRHRNYE